MGLFSTLFRRWCQSPLVMHNELAEAIVGLTEELREAREERRRSLVTRVDLSAAEKRIIAAIGSGISDSDRALLDAYAARVERSAKKLEALDAAQ